MRLGVVGDVGLTYNSTDTISHLVAHDPEMVIFTGGRVWHALQMPPSFPRAHAYLAPS